MSHTTSVPSIPVTMTTNGIQDNKDYDGLYESVMNFSTLKEGKDVPKNNNNSHKALSKSSSVLVTSTVQSDQVKVNGSHRNSFHGDTDKKVAKDSKDGQTNMAQDDTVPVPPKRPVRKKKSLRTKEDLARTSSNSSQGTEKSRSDSGAKMPMEYFSDSSEMSPRDSPAGGGRKHMESDSKASKMVQGDSPEATRNVVNINVRNNDVPEEVKVENNKEAKHSNTIIQVTYAASTKVPKVQPEVTNNSDSGIIMGIKGRDDHDVNQNNGIVELDADDRNEPLEVQTVEFNSQPRNFQPSDFTKLSSEDNQHQKLMADVIGRKMKVTEDDKRVPPMVNTQAAGTKLSASLESLDEIDKILKEQVYF